MTWLAAVERQQLAENVFVRDVIWPAMCGSHGRVEGMVCVGERPPIMLPAALLDG